MNCKDFKGDVGYQGTVPILVLASSDQRCLDLEFDYFVVLLKILNINVTVECLYIMVLDKWHNNII
jgi:hypothetical protein